MKKFILILTIVLSSLFHLSVKSEFGDADFDIDNFPKDPLSKKSNALKTCVVNLLTDQTAAAGPEPGGPFEQKG